MRIIEIIENVAGNIERCELDPDEYDLLIKIANRVHELKLAGVVLDGELGMALNEYQQSKTSPCKL